MKKYFVSLAYEVIVDAEDEDTAIKIACEDIERSRELGADFDNCWAEEFEEI